ncbi:MAG: site-specific integrase [Bacteroidales bacterium]|nr:site-specific integrase [Bacteroidales bacterium]MBR6066731.1 site-specific integrase [Bacteroidales bacterium]
MAGINICYNRRKTQNADIEEKPIEIEIYFDDKKRIYINTGIKVEEKCFDKKRNEINSKCNLQQEYNAHLWKQVEELRKLELKAKSEGLPFTREYLEQEQRKAELKKGDFLEYCTKINDNEYKAGQIKLASWKKYRSMISAIDRYCNENRISLTYNRLTADFVTELHQYLSQRYAPSFLNRTFTNLKKFTDKAIHDGLIRNNPFSDYKRIKERPSERTALSTDELERLEELDRKLLNAIDFNLEHILDRFLFSCYTGLRISDSQRLTAKNFMQSTYGLTLDIVTEKGAGKRVVIPLDLMFDGKATAIANKYLAQNLPHLFPQFSDQKINAKLKILAGLAQIKIPLTFHTARHTCATMLAEKTGNPFVIMQILGHSDIKTSMIYIHNSTSAVANVLKGVNW